MAMNPWFRICLAASLLLSFSLSQAQQPLFPITRFNPASTTNSSAVGDFNGDGSPDLAFPDSPLSGTSFPTITVLLGPSSAPVKVTTSGLTCTVQYVGGTQSLLAIDINNDKKTDLVFLCKEGYVGVLLGKGDGTFQPAAYYPLTGAASLAAVDLNGDGYLDIVASTSIVGTGPSAINIMLNQGTSAPGTLLSPKSYPVTAFGGGIGIGDFNGDGKQDILVNALQGPTDDWQLAVFYGNGDGTLQTQQAIQSPPGGTTFVAADLNHDGFTDVAYLTTPGSFLPQAIQVVLGQSNGLFTVGSSLQLSASVDYSDLVLAGTTNSGKNINLAAIGGITTILLGDGNGGFSAGHSYAQSGNVAVEPGTNGNYSFIFSTGAGLTSLTGNGDGTFQGIPATPVGPNGFVTADLNNDGLTDLVFIDSQRNLTGAIGRGDGSFTTAGQVTGAPYFGIPGTGDFNSDGKIDAVAILPGNGVGHGATTAQDSELFFYKGNGDGTFQPSTPGVDLQVIGASGAVTGDFNGDGKLDVIVQYYNLSAGTPTTGLVFLPGNGDGSFGTPVSFAQGTACPNVLVADLNKDGKLDLVCGAVFLGKGDGSFNQQPLGLVGTTLALGDLNGDGIPDIVIPVAGVTTSQVAIYAGRGDGTFQTSPFYTTTALTQYGLPVASATIGDVNADGNADLLIPYSSNVAVFLGNGQGTFTPDSNTYFMGTGGTGSETTGPLSVLARLNNQAPAPASDRALDYLGFSGGAVTSLLNQTNPAPSAPSPLASKISLVASLTTAAPGQQLTLTATVTGLAPTGIVSFLAGGKTLGTGSLSKGVATLSTSFAAAGSFSVTASYTGDANNLSSTSNSVAITVVAPDYTVTASPAMATITVGQSATTTLIITPVGGYNGTVKFSCGTLPAGATCTFAPATITPSGSAVTTTLTVATTATTTSLLRPFSTPLQGIALAFLFVVGVSPRRIRVVSYRLLRAGFLSLIAFTSLISLSGCNSPTKTTNPGTPIGVQTLVVTTADSSGVVSHAINFQVTIQ